MPEINPNFRWIDWLRVIRGTRNGIYYGGKVRLMHSLVTALVFMNGSITEKLKKVISLTLEHSVKLGIYVGFYKFLVLLLQKKTQSISKIHYFLAGIASGFIVYRQGESAINQQMILYLVSRDIIGTAKNLQDKGVFPRMKFFSMLAAISWGLVMLLYEDNKDNLQRSLSVSMDFLYQDSEVITDWTEFVPFYIPHIAKQHIEIVFKMLIRALKAIWRLSN